MNINESIDLIIRDHRGGILSIDYSMNDNILITGGEDGVVYIYHLNDFFNEINEKGYDLMNQHENNDNNLLNLMKNKINKNSFKNIKGYLQIRSVSFSSNFQSILSSCGNVAYINSLNGELVNSLVGHNYNLRSACYSSNDQKIATSSVDSTVIIWDGMNYNILQVLRGHRHWVTNAIFYPKNENFVISSGWDYKVKVWNIEENNCEYTFEDESSIMTIAFSSDNQILAIGHLDRIASLIFSNNDQYLISSSWDESIIIWDYKNDKIVKVLHGHDNCIRTIKLCNNNKYIISGSLDRTVKLWDYENIIKQYEEKNSNSHQHHDINQHDVDDELEEINFNSLNLK